MVGCYVERIICSLRSTLMVGCDEAKNYIFLEIHNGCKWKWLD